MKNTNDTGYVSAETTKETKLKAFSDKDKDVTEMSIEVIEVLLDNEKGPIRPYTDGDITQRFKESLSKKYDPNSFIPMIDRKKGIVYAVSKKEQFESDKEYCSLCEKYMKPTNDSAVPDGVECNGIFASCGEIPCKHFEKDARSQALKKAFDESIDYNWSYYRAPDENEYAVVALDPKGWNPILAKTDKFLVEHICKTHNDWLAFKQKNSEKKIKKGNLRRLKNLAWKMNTFRQAFQLIQRNNYLGFNSIKEWIKKNENDVNYWIFTKWLRNSSNYEEWTWYFWNQGNFINQIVPDEYSDICSKCQDINYFQFGKHISMAGVPEGDWDSYTFHQECESKLFADGKAYTAALVLEKMFEFAEEYVKHTGYITAEMAGKYHIDLKLEEFGGEDIEDMKNDVKADLLAKEIIKDSDDKFYEKYPNGKLDFKKPLEKRVDDLEKMVRDIWQNVCPEKQPAEIEDNLPNEIINKKPILEGQTCPRCRKSKEGCEFYDKGTCRGIVYPTYPPQFDPCVFEK